MPVSKKKPTIPVSEVSTQESSSPALPEQEEFRQYFLSTFLRMALLSSGDQPFRRLKQSGENRTSPVFALMYCTSDSSLHPQTKNGSLSH